MEKIWFIFIDNHHRGPFSSAEIFKMYHSDEIHQESLVWRQGLSKWVFLRDCEELWNEISPLENPPEVPAQASEPLKEDEELPPEFPYHNTPPHRPSLESENSESENEEIPSIRENRFAFINNLKIKKLKTSSLWVFAGIVCCLLFAYFSDFSSKETVPAWGGLSLRESERLKNLTQVRMRDGMKVGFAGLAKDKRIFFASNRKGPAVLTVQLSSIPKRILGQEEVVFTSEAKLEGHYAVFDQLSFLKSDRIVPGYYRVSLEGVSFSPYRKLINKLIDFGFLSKDAYSARFIYRGELLISDVPPSVFAQNLESYHAKLADEAALPYTDLNERYQTLYSFAEQLMILYTKTLEKSSDGFDQKAFEKNYDLEIGHPFKVFVEDSVKLKEEYATKRPHMVEEFDSFLTDAQTVGALAGEMLDKTLKKAKSKKKKIKESERKELVGHFNEMIEKLKNTLKSKSALLESKIQEAKKVQN